MTRYDVHAARRRERIKEIERKGRLAKWNDYVSFFAAKAAGVGGLSVGGLELLVPDLLPITIAQPVWVAATGLALLTGKSVIKLVSAASEALEGKKSEP